MAKITDPSKLLPSAKSTAITKIGKSNFTSPLKISKRSTSITKGLLGESDQKDAVDVNNKLVKVEKFFQSDLLVSKKKVETKRKEKEKEDFKKEEEKLEAPKEAKKFNLPSLSFPGMSFLDRIKRFLIFTALGWVFTKFQDQLPKLLGVVKLITGVYGVVENTFKFLLSSFVNFVERGYDTYDKIRGIAKSIGGEKAQQDFDNLSSKLNEYINYALIGGMALTGAIDAFGKQLKAEKVAKEASKKAGAKEVGKGVTQELTKRAAKKGIIQRTTQAARIGAKKGAQAVVGKQGVKQLLRLAKGPLSRLPILGGLIEFGLSWALGDPVGKAAFRGVGTLLLGAVGSLILPGFGTFVGGLAGAELAGKLYEVLFENKRSQGNVQRKQGGGPVTRGGKPQGRGPSRTLTITRRRPPKIKPKQSQPGKDVGGKKKIRELYPDPSARTDIEGEQKGAWWNLLPPLPANATVEQKTQREAKIKALPNPYKALTNAAKVLKDIPFGIGALMGGAVDIALGQKLPKDAIKGLGSGISYLITSIANRQISTTLSGIEKEVSKMQTGGVVRPRDFTKGSEVGPGEGITKALDNLIYQKVDEAIREVQKQLMPGKYNEKDDLGGGGGGGGGGEDAPGARLRDGSNAKIEADLLEYFTALYGKNAALGIVTNLQRESGYRTKTPNNPDYEGIIQWDRKDRWPRYVKWAESKGYDPYNRNAQVQYVAIELKQYGLDDDLKNAKTPEEAAQIFYEKFEKGADTGSYSGSSTEEKHLRFLGEIKKRNPDIGKRTNDVVITPTASPGKIPKADYVKGVLDESGEPGFDVTWKGDNNIAILPGRVKEVGQLYGANYGNVVVVESVDPVTGKKVDVLYAHFPTGGISVRPGQQVGTGQALGRMGKPGESGIGNITGQHASIDFYQPNSNSRYSRWDGLSREIISSAQTGNNPSNWPKPQTQPPAAKSSVRSAQEIQKIKNNLVRSGDRLFVVNGKNYYLRVRPGDPPQVIQKGGGFLGTDQFIDISGGKNSSIRNAIDSSLGTSYGITLSDLESNRPAQPARTQQTPPQRSSGVTSGPGSSGYGGAQGGGYISKQSPKRNVSSLKSYPSYADGGIMIAIQPMIIEKPIPVPMAKNKTLMFPISIEVNNSMPSLSRG